ncbi:MAG: cation:proton antiporter [Nitrospiria bacterium]
MTVFQHYQETLAVIAGFGLVALASKEIGRFFVKIKLPLVSGFLFTGILAGPSVLALLPVEAASGLRFVDEVSLAFIAFAAGSELHIKKLRSRLKSITCTIAGLVVITFILGSVTLFMLCDFIPFAKEMPPLSRIAISILGGVILVARSPSSAIAVIHELRAKGPFTQTALGVTVMMDVVVVIFFSVNSSIADALLTGAVNFGFIFLVLAEILVSFVIGLSLGRLFQILISKKWARSLETFLILLLGYGVFFLTDIVHHLSQARLPFGILLEPLLICMVAGYLLTNHSKYRHEFMTILHKIGPPIYTAFFTLTGASLLLGDLSDTWLIALALFAVRLIGIMLGAFVGGTVAGEPMPRNRISWMAYITQAGIGLGLAKEVSVAFPAWGGAFASLLISVIVLNQIVGPPFFKWAIHLAGEVRPHEDEDLLAFKLPSTL